MLKFGVLTVSDSSFANNSLDKSGPKLIELIEKYYANNHVTSEIVPDDEKTIQKQLIKWSDENFAVVFTTGGTGIAPRDVTPEATRAVIDREVPGMSYAMISKSLTITPFAMLSRAVCGIRKKTLIINFPGSVKAVEENFHVVNAVIPHAVSLINDDFQQIKKSHNAEGNNSQKSTPSKVKVSAVASRDRKSPYPMVDEEDAIQMIFTCCPQASESELVHRSEALGRVLAEDVISLDPLPPFRASIKDGYAVRASDGAGPRTVQNVVNAGDNDLEELKVGHCIRISTGAPVPLGADAVVQVEDTELISVNADNTVELEVDIKVAPTVGQDIRQPGSDIPAHTVILKNRILLNPAEIGILAAVGRDTVRVYKRMSVGVISTGNELQKPEDLLQFGKIRDSNKDTILNLLKKYGYSGTDFGIVRDDPNSLKQRLEEVFERCDMAITTGGVSMGELDVVKQVLKQDFNAVIHFGRLNLKPGKPTTFATCFYKERIKLIFALPGNPVSATVTSLLFVIPALRQYENRPTVRFPKTYIYLPFTPTQDKQRPEYQRVNLHFGHEITGSSTGDQISSRLNSFSGANGLIYVPDASHKFSRSSVPCYLLENF